MKITGIYKIESKIKPERIYIGSAVDIGKRWGTHLSRLRNSNHGNPKLQSHFNKYGDVDLEFSILLGCERDDLIKNEQYFIDSYKPWFNIRKIADSNLGLRYKLSQETRIKMFRKRLDGDYKLRAKGISPSKETRLKISNSLKGRIKSAEECKNISKGQLGIKKPKTEEQKKRISIWQKGRKHSEKTKKKMSESMMGNKNNLGRKLTDKHKKAVSEGMKRVWKERRAS